MAAHRSQAGKGSSRSGALGVTGFNWNAGGTEPGKAIPQPQPRKTTASRGLRSSEAHSDLLMSAAKYSRKEPAKEPQPAERGRRGDAQTRGCRACTRLPPSSAPRVPKWQI